MFSLWRLVLVVSECFVLWLDGEVTCSSCLFDVCSARYSALSQHTSLLPAACSRLLVLTYHEQHSVESGLLGPNINVSRENLFCLCRSRAVR